MDTLNEKIKKFLEVGFGSGSGDGDGSGYGSGSGSGSGYGFGSGSGYGFGSGFGSGDGSGYGSGDGFGSGYGIEEFEGHKVYDIDGVPTCITHVNGRCAFGFTIKDNSVKVPCFIARVEKYFAHGESLHEAFDAAYDKAMEEKPVEERVAEVVKKHPDPTAKIPNKELFNLHHVLTGSCEFGRRQFCERHGIDMEGFMTMEDFCKITSNDYGREAIALLAAEYNKQIRTNEQ